MASDTSDAQTIMVPNSESSTAPLLTTSMSSEERMSETEQEAAGKAHAVEYPSLQKERPWWKGVVAYQIWPMSFKDSNDDGIGDIQGIICKLDYLKELGVDMIWVSPTYDSPMKDWGYDISNYQTMQRKFGKLADMEQLIEEVHNRGMKIILDLVITHTSDQHEWFKESSSSRDSPKADWYMWADRRPGHTIRNDKTKTDDKIEEPTNWRAAFGGSAWSYVQEREQYYLHLFLDSQPDLNWENAEMREAVYESAVKFWIDRGVDGFRLDTANRFCKDTTWPDADVQVPGPWQPGSQYYMNGRHMHAWLKEIRQKMKRDSGKDLMIVGELPLASYEQVLSYVKPDADELNMVFDFDMVKLGNNDNPDEFAKHQVCNYMDKDESYTLPKFKTTVKKVQNLITNTNAWGTVFMENHDQPRSIARYASPKNEYWRQAGKLLALLQTTLSGTQFIYQGQEIGMTNMPHNWAEEDFRDPDAIIYIKDYVDMHHSTDPRAKDKAMQGIFKVGRDNSRTPVQWSNKPNAGFSGPNPTWMKVNPNCDYINVVAQQEDANSIWNFWKARIEMRKQYKEVFMYGTFALYDFDNPRTFTYTKMATTGEMALVILNFSDDELPLSTVQRHLLGHSYALLATNVNDLHEQLQPWEGRVYEVRQPLAPGKNGAARNIGEVQDVLPVRAEQDVDLVESWREFQRRRNAVED